MPPDDLPIDQADEDSTKLPGTKPLIKGAGQAVVSAEAEVRGGSAQPGDLPIEQQQRQDRPRA